MTELLSSSNSTPLAVPSPAALGLVSGEFPAAHPILARARERSVAAAQALTQARFRNAFNILEGFEGELDDLHQRGNHSGWRFHRLPWSQD